MAVIPAIRGDEMDYLCANPECLQTMVTDHDWFQLLSQKQILHCPACNMPLVSRKEYENLQEKIKRDAEDGESKIEEAISVFEKVKAKSQKGILERVSVYLRAFYDMMRDPNAAVPNKIYAAIAFLYLVSPLDIIPDPIPIIGHVDDYLVIMAVVSLLGSGLVSYMKDAGERKRPMWQGKTLLIERFDLGQYANITENHYYEDRHLRCWRVNSSALDRTKYKPIMNQLFRKNETFMLHPILKNTLIGFKQFNTYILEQKRRELQLLFSGLGAMEAEYTHCVEKCKKTSTRLDLSLLHAFEASGKASLSEKNHTFERMSETRKQSGNIDTSLAFIDELVWLFEEPASIQDFCYRRIMNGESELKREFVHESERYFSAEAKASAKKIGATLSQGFEVSTSEAVKTVSTIKYAPLKLPEGETKETFYTRVKEKIESRMLELQE